MPDILLARIKDDARKTKVGFSDWVESAARLKLDGSPAVQPRTEVHNNGKAASLLERFAGLGVTTANVLERAGPTINVGNCPTEDVEPNPVIQRRDWRKFYSDMMEMEPAEAEYAFSQATAEVKLPHGFRRQPPAKQVAWLQVNA